MEKVYSSIGLGREFVSKNLTLILAGAAVAIVSLALYIFVPRTKEPQAVTSKKMAPVEQNPPQEPQPPANPPANPPASSQSDVALETKTSPISRSNNRSPKRNVASIPPSKPQPQAVSEQLKDLLVLKEIRFKGVKSFSNESMQALVSKFLGVPLSFEDLPEIAVDVENFYKQNNYVARVILAQQDVADGILILDVMESSLPKDKVDIQLSEMPPQQAIEINSTPDIPTPKTQASESKPVVEEQIQNQISNQQNETDLILKMYKNHTRQSELILDNFGESKFGVERVEGQFSWFNTWLPYDELKLSALISKGSEFFKSNYSLPIGKSGWNLGLNATAMDYKVIAGHSADLGEIGKAFTQALELNYPLTKSFSAESDLRLTAQASQHTHVTAAGYSLSEYDTEVLVAEFSGVDRAFAKTTGTLTYAIQWSMGQVNIQETAQSIYADQGGVLTEGQFNKVRTNITYIEPWSPTTDLYVGLTGQLADRNLTYAEKIQMGGALGIRAYPSGTGMASNGQMLNLELRHRLENGLLLTGFYDWGHVAEMVNPDPSAPANLPNSYELKGFGLSAAYNFRNGASLKATWAQRDGKDPRSADTKTDHPIDRNRYWLQITVPF